MGVAYGEWILRHLDGRSLPRTLAVVEAVLDELGRCRLEEATIRAAYQLSEDERWVETLAAQAVTFEKTKLLESWNGGNEEDGVDERFGSEDPDPALTEDKEMCDRFSRSFRAWADEFNKIECPDRPHDHASKRGQVFYFAADIFAWFRDDDPRATWAKVILDPTKSSAARRNDLVPVYLEWLDEQRARSPYGWQPRPEYRKADARDGMQRARDFLRGKNVSEALRPLHAKIYDAVKGLF